MANTHVAWFPNNPNDTFSGIGTEEFDDKTIFEIEGENEEYTCGQDGEGNDYISRPIRSGEETLPTAATSGGELQPSGYTPPSDPIKPW